MAVDEFGREIPASNAQPPPVPPSSLSPPAYQQYSHHHPRGGGGSDRGSVDRDRGVVDHHRDRDRDSRSRDRDPLPPRDRSRSGDRGGGRDFHHHHHHAPSHRHRDDIGGGGGFYGRGGGGGPPSSSHRSQSPPPPHHRYHGGGGGGYHEMGLDGRDRDRDRDRDHGGEPRGAAGVAPAVVVETAARGLGAAGTAPIHPSKIYQEESMLCEFLWKKKNEQQTMEGMNATGGENSADATTLGQQEQQQSVKSEELDDESKRSSQPQEEGDTATGVKAENEPSEKIDEQQLASSYGRYRRDYCLRFIQLFFNHHLDDSWFRTQYSPLGRRRYQETERVRAASEAQAYFKNIATQLIVSTSALRPSTKLSTILEPVRLGGGVKVSSGPLGAGDGGTSNQTNPNAIPALHLLEGTDRMLHIQDIPPHVTEEQLRTALQDHVQVIADQYREEKQKQAQQQKKQQKSGGVGKDGGGSAGADNPNGDVEGEPGIQIFSGTVYTTTHWPRGGRKNHYHFNHQQYPPFLSRQAIVICSSKRLQQDLLGRFKLEHDKREKSGRGSGVAGTATSPLASAKSATFVPRKGGADEQQQQQQQLWYEFEIDCSDPYGRLEYDADGKGGAPADGLQIPMRKATVRIAVYQSMPDIRVLSAALSSKHRIPRDKDSAIVLARALDISKQIPSEHRLDELLEKLQDYQQQTTTIKAEDSAAKSSSSSTNAVPDEDILDVAIAYLRRVHLFSFYNGCSRATNVADVLTGKAAPIHLRLANADDILDQAAPPSSTRVAGDTTKESNETTIMAGEDSTDVNAKDNGGDQYLEGSDSKEESAESKATLSAPEPPKDLLVQRLDDSISKALEDCNAWINSGAYVIDEETDRDAALIEEAEQEMRETWLQDHAILDDDNRARCSFHFCHKLFKGTSFLHKHLFKKHGEFLKAEQAKCHDEYMMKEWDLQENRPVPEILVDCGTKFGLVSVPLKGRVPDCDDPEPELWRKEEERRKMYEEQRQRREEYRELNRRQANDARPEITNTGEGGGGGGHGGGGGRGGRSNFVDVDDMKEEKVDLSFDKVAIPPPVATKKKKKKRKLL